MASLRQSVFLWRDEELAAIRDALASAARGEPTALSISGRPGAGKSALLERVIVEAADFAVLFAEGDQLTRDRPYRLLDELLGSPHPTDPATSPFQAAQAVRRELDSLARGRPAVLAIDDAQWADPESIATLRWVLARAAGDPLLVALASRSAAQRDDVMRLLESGARVFSAELAGLDADQVARLVGESHPGAPAVLAQRLWSYTGGHPLSVRQLLAEYDADALAEATTIPIPRALARAMERRLAAFRQEARTVAEAAAVLGPGWVEIEVLASVAEVRVGDAIAEVAEEGLLVARTLDPGAPVRIQHEVLRDAVYAALPVERRTLLHRRAARFAASLGERLRHRVAAADGADAELAAELAAFAATSVREKSWRVSAQYLQWASGVEPDERRREELRSEALISRAYARDRDVRPELVEQVASAADRARARVALAVFEHTRYAWPDVARALEGVSEQDLARTDSVTRFRFHGLQAAAAQYAGAPGRVVLEMLERAWAEPDHDSAIASFFQSTGVQAMIPERGIGEPWLGRELRSRVALKPRDLAQRGIGLLSDHRIDEAREDLEEYRRQIEAGQLEESGGTHFGMLGIARWLGGDRRGASEAVRVAVDQLDDGRLHPAVMSVRPLAAIADGDAALARRHSEESRRMLVRAPWRLGAYAHLTVEGIRLELHGTTEERRSALGMIRRELGEVEEVASGAPVLARTLLGMAALWSDEPGVAERLLAGVVIPPGYSPSAERMRDWLGGRIAAYRGESVAAVELFRSALGSGSSEMPYYAARMREDLATALEDQRPAEAAELHSAAAAAYRRLGVEPAQDGSLAEAVQRADPFGMLSERERDVADLVVRGLSYDQIAQRLYITKSTVSFHLSKVYAKTNTRRRHDLVGLVQSATQ